MQKASFYTLLLLLLLLLLYTLFNLDIIIGYDICFMLMFYAFLCMFSHCFVLYTPLFCQGSHIVVVSIWSVTFTVLPVTMIKVPIGPFVHVWKRLHFSLLKCPICPLFESSHLYVCVCVNRTFLRVSLFVKHLGSELVYMERATYSYKCFVLLLYYNCVAFSSPGFQRIIWSHLLSLAWWVDYSPSCSCG